ncbi:MAG TPA: TonB-dependent siderophore receptor [Methylophilaceae bacterium]|nr:TonB-dependent siderophore receptor [Methylophilaceae bacterium]
MRKNRSFTVKPIVALVTLSLYGAVAQAEEKAADTDRLPEISVKAKVPLGALPGTYAGGQIARGGRIGVLGNQDFMDVPFNMTSYTAKVIEDQQARTIADVLINDPSVRMGQSFGTAAQTFVIRGYPVLAEDLAFNGLYGITPRQLPAIEGVERLEVIKGANAFLNGVSPSGSGIGGTVNIVPKRAADAPLTRATIDYGSNGQVGGHADLGRRFGPDNQFGIRLNAVQRGGSTAIHGEDSRLTYGTLGLDFTGEKLRLSADLSYQKQTVTQPRLAVNVGAGVTNMPHAPDSKVNYSQPWTSTSIESTSAVFRGEYDFSTNAMGYAAIGFGHNNEMNDLSALTISANNGSASTSRFANPYDVSTASSEAGVNFRFETGPVKHKVNVGTATTQSNARSNFIFLGIATPTSIYDPVDVAKPAGASFTGSLNDPEIINRVRNRSYAVSDTLSFLDDKISITLGLRRQSIQVINYSYFTGAESDDSDKSVTTPVYGVVIKPWKPLSLYANHIEGLSQGAVAPLGTTNFGTVLSPSRSKQNEIGAKVDFGSYGAGLAVFEIERPSTTTEGGIFANNGEQLNTGVEFNAYGEPVAGWRVLGGAAFTDAELTKTENGTNDGKTSFGVPKNQYNLGTEYDVAELPGLTLTGRWIRTGSQYVNQTNTLSIPSWDRFDLGARYATKLSNYDVKFRANVENLFDKDYWAAVSPTFGQVTMGAPRTFRLSATFDF